MPGVCVWYCTSGYCTPFIFNKMTHSSFYAFEEKKEWGFHSKFPMANEPCYFDFPYFASSGPRWCCNWLIEILKQAMSSICSFLLFSLFWSLSLLITLVMVQFFVARILIIILLIVWGDFYWIFFPLWYRSSMQIFFSWIQILWYMWLKKKAYLICIHEKNTCILTILNDMPGKKVKQLAKKFDCDWNICIHFMSVYQSACSNSWIIIVLSGRC